MACGVIVQDRTGAIAYANRAAMSVSAGSELLGPTIGFERIAANGAKLRMQDLPTSVVYRTTAPVRNFVLGVRHDDGATRWWLVDSVPMLDPAGEVTEVVTSFIDVTQQRESENALREQALRDALTQLANRGLFMDRLEHAIAAAVRNKLPLALLLMDLDHFKEVNDTFGHHAGDELLRQVATRLGDAVRRSDSLARLGGDEFAVLLEGTNEASAQVVARTILHALEDPFTIEGQELDVGGSIGIGLFPRHGEDANTLMRRADIAMYTAKRSGHGSATYNFEDELDEGSPHRLTMMAELRRGLEQGELPLLYQPLIELDSGRGSRAEALVRWRHPTRGLVPPSEFIAAAERSGLVKALFEHVLRTALRECQGWRNEGFDLRVSVNLSVRNLLDPSITETVAQCVAEAGLTAAWLGLEITETTLMADPERSLRALTRLRNMGIHLAIDDFGVGYSSLAYLQRLPVYAVKIDRSFINDMVHDLSSRAIVQATIELAHRLGLRAVAEGVENQQTFEMLGTLGCDSVQGFYIGRPMMPQQLREWATRNRDEQIVELRDLRARKLQRDVPVKIDAGEATDGREA